MVNSEFFVGSSFLAYETAQYSDLSPVHTIGDFF